MSEEEGNYSAAKVERTAYPPFVSSPGYLPNALQPSQSGDCETLSSDRDASSQALINAVAEIIQIVEGFGCVKWHHNGFRLKDTNEWCRLYVAWSEYHQKISENNACISRIRMEHSGMNETKIAIKPEGKLAYRVSLNDIEIGLVEMTIYGCAAAGMRQQPTPGAAIADLLKKHGASESSIYAATVGL